MSLVKDFSNVTEIKIVCEDTLKTKKKTQIVFKKANEILNKVIQIKSNSENENDFKEKVQNLKREYKIETYKQFINFFEQHFTTEISLFNTAKLIISTNTKKYELCYSLYFFEPNILTNEAKINNVRLKLDTSSYLPNNYYTTLNSDTYKRFVNFMSENSDVTDWFCDFLKYIDSHIEQKESNENKLKEYILMLYENSKDEIKYNFLANKNVNEIQKIIDVIKIMPKSWTMFIPLVENYANEKIKGSKEKPHDYISREILNNTATSRSVNDLITRYYKRERKRKKATESRLTKK